MKPRRIIMRRNAWHRGKARANEASQSHHRRFTVGHLGRAWLHAHLRSSTQSLTSPSQDQYTVGKDVGYSCWVLEPNTAGIEGWPMPPFNIQRPTCADIVDMWRSTISTRLNHSRPTKIFRYNTPKTSSQRRRPIWTATSRTRVGRSRRLYRRWRASGSQCSNSVETARQ